MGTVSCGWLLLLPVSLLALSADDAARDLARRVSASLSQGENISLTVQSKLGPAFPTAPLESSLKRAFAQRLKAQATATVTVTLSENQSSPLLVGVLSRGEEQRVFLAPFDFEPPPPHIVRSPVTLEVRRVWEQPYPILDLAIAASNMVVLEPGSVAIYQREAATFRLRTRLSPPPGMPSPRDARGRLLLDGDIVRAYLPGVLCRVSLSGENLECDDRTGDWPLDAGAGIALPASLVVGRNFFEAPPMPAFYTAARWRDQWVLALTTGQTQLRDGSGMAITTLGNWGTEIAAIDSSCLADRVIVGSRGGSLETFTLGPGNRPLAASEPAPFPGQLTALWPSEQPGILTAIAYSVETDRYAAYRVSLDCGR
jgi:hypothetical protein